MSQVDCVVDIPKVEGLEDAKLTVGRHINLNCSGEMPEGFSYKDANFKLDEAVRSTAKVFSVKSSESGKFSMDFTFYTAGEHPLNKFVLTDGVNEIALNAPSVTVESVLKPTEDGKPQEPFGPVFPVSIQIPVYYFIFVIAVVVLVALFTVFRFKRISYYRKLKAKLKNYSSPLEPDMQFYKSVRMAEKLEYPVDKLEQAFRLYNLRAYQLPLFDLSNDRVMKYFKRNYPQYKSTRLVLHKLLGEFEELNKKSKDLSFQEKQDFVKKLYRYVDKNKGLNP